MRRVLWVLIAVGSIVAGCGRSGTWPRDPDAGAPSLPLPEFRPTAIPTGSETGTGADGIVVVTSDGNLTTDGLAAGRTCGDAVWYPVASLAASSAVLGTTPAAGCLAEGDEILLVTLRGASLGTANVGVYESLRVQAVSGSSATFTTNKKWSYGSGAGSDADIGSAAGQQRVVVQRVPNYRSLTVQAGATLTVDVFDGIGGGVFAVRVLETAQIDGAIDVSARGFRGGVPGGRRAEATAGPLALDGGGGGGGSGGHNGTNVCGASGLGTDGARNGYCGNVSSAAYSPCPATPNMCTTNGCGGSATGSAGGGGAGYGFSAGRVPEERRERVPVSAAPAPPVPLERPE